MAAEPAAKKIWRFRAVNIVFALSLWLYVFVYVNVPFALRPGSIHDDGLFISQGFSLAAGKWLGPYSQFTLMKGAGYPAFLAFVSWLRIPFPLAQALLFGASIWLLALLTRRLFHSTALTIAVFELALWNFGPETNRLLRDAIYQSQFVLCFALTVWAFLESGRREQVLGLLAGLCFGWMWITREEGLMNAPAFFLVGSYFAMLRWRRKQRWRPWARITGLFIAGAVLPGFLVASANKIRYGKFQTVDANGDFARAMSALESIEQPNEQPFLAVSGAVRKKAYAASPTFQKLEKYFDDPGVPEVQKWMGIGCEALPSTCGDYATGWFMWALRDAAFVDGQYANPNRAAEFYGKIYREINQACGAQKLICHSTAAPLVPHLTAAELKQAPLAAGALIKRLLFLSQPEVQDGFSWGSVEEMRQAVVFTGVENYSPPPDVAPQLLNRRAIYAARLIKAFCIACYARMLPVLIPLSWLAWAACLISGIRTRRIELGIVLVTAAWIAIGLRILMLALIHVTAFPALFHYYLSFCFPMSCFAALVSLYVAGQMFGYTEKMQLAWRRRSADLERSDTMLSHES